MAALTPRSTALFVAGMFAVTACPPFGPFFSLLQMLRAALVGEHPHPIAAALFLVCLLLAFLGLTRVVFGITDGRPSVAARANARRFVETAGVVAPPLLLLVLCLWLGLFTPPILREAWAAAADQLFPAP
jgi:hydrogenase-4 component F